MFALPAASPEYGSVFAAGAPKSRADFTPHWVILKEEGAGGGGRRSVIRGGETTLQP